MRLNTLNRINILFILILSNFILFNTGVLADFPAFPADEGVVLIEFNSGDVILSQNADQKFYPASTTKLMTALVMTDYLDSWDEIVTVGDEVTDYGWSDSRAGLEQGMTLNYRDLLHALLVPSGNDAAGTIAVSIGRKILNDPNAERHAAQDAFVNAMNQKAQELGLKNTHFVNPSGTFNEDHYTTPNDMAIIAREAFKNGEVKSAASTKIYNLTDTNGVTFPIRSTNLLLFDNAAEYGRQIVANVNPEDPNSANINPYKTDLITAAKTGSTQEGGRTLVYLSEMNGENIIGVLFKTTESGIFDQSKQILEELNNNYSSVEFTEADGYYDSVNLLNVHFRNDDSIGLYAKENVTSYINNALSDTFNTEIRWNSDYIDQDTEGNLELINNIEEGSKVGALIITNENYSKTIPLYSDKEVKIKNWQDFILENKITVTLFALTLIALVVLVIALVIYYRKKKVNRSSQYNQLRF